MDTNNEEKYPMADETPPVFSADVTRVLEKIQTSILGRSERITREQAAEEFSQTTAVTDESLGSYNGDNGDNGDDIGGCGGKCCCGSAEKDYVASYQMLQQSRLRSDEEAHRIAERALKEKELNQKYKQDRIEQARLNLLALSGSAEILVTMLNDYQHGLHGRAVLDAIITNLKVMEEISTL